MEVASVDISTLHLKPIPTPPSEIIKYAKDRISKKTHQMKEGFFRAPHLATWLTQIDKWRSLNLSNYSWLKAHENDKDTKSNVEVLIKEYDNKRWEWWSFGYDFMKVIAAFSYTPSLNTEGQSYYDKT